MLFYTCEILSRKKKLNKKFETALITSFILLLRDNKRNRSNEHNSDEQYQHLQNVSNTFNFNNYYFKKDVLVLADVFQKFISNCLKYDGLDPCHYFRAPGLSWGANKYMIQMNTCFLNKE